MRDIIKELNYKCPKDIRKNCLEVKKICINYMTFDKKGAYCTYPKKRPFSLKRVPLVILAIFITITAHELGHLLIGLYYNASVKTFSIGFGWELYSFLWKGIEFKVRAILLGGYVSFDFVNIDKGLFYFKLYRDYFNFICRRYEQCYIMDSF